MVKLTLSALLIFVGLLGWYLTQSVGEPSQVQASSGRPVAHDEFDALLASKPDLISIEDLPEELRAEVTEKIAQDALNGFVEVSEFEADEIINIEKHIIGLNISDANITFEPSEFPSQLVENYDYLGYTHPNYSIKKAVKNMRNGTLRRLYKSHDSGRLLIVEESSDSVGPGAVQIAEAINASVAQRPAIFNIMKSVGDQTYASLSWTTKKWAFNLYQIDDVENSKELLLRLGGEITMSLSLEQSDSE